MESHSFLAQHPSSHQRITPSRERAHKLLSLARQPKQRNKSCDDLRTRARERRNTPYRTCERVRTRAYTSKIPLERTQLATTWRPETSPRRPHRPPPTAHRPTTSSSALCESVIVSRSLVDHADTASSNAIEAIHATIVQSAATRRHVTMPRQRVRSRTPPVVPINLLTTCKIALIDWRVWYSLL